MGKQKGLLQILWERGFINTSKDVYKYYTMTGSKDVFGNMIPVTNLTAVMDSCTNFIKEMTTLQEVMDRLGVTVHSRQNAMSIFLVKESNISSI